MAPSRLTFQLVQELGGRIVRGENPPGCILPTERELGERHGVSRTVVRESMKMLAAKGLVEPRSRRGTQVRARSDWNLFDADLLCWAQKDMKLFEDLSELRRIVEPVATELAAQRATADDLQELRRQCERMERAERQRRLTAFNRADLAFHLALARASHNAAVQHLFTLIQPLLRLNFEVTLHLLSTEASGVRLHRRVLDAIEARDAPTARGAMEAVIAQARANAAATRMAAAKHRSHDAR